MQIGNYRITQSNASRHYQSSVKVMREGCIIAHVRSDSGNLLNYIRKHWHCAERAELIAQLVQAGVPTHEVDMLLKVDSK